MAEGVVHAEGGDGFVETFAVFFEGGLDRRAEAGVRNARDDAEELGLHLHRVVLRDRGELTHDRRVGALGVGDWREGVDLEVGTSVEVADRTAHADDGTGLEAREDRLHR